MFENVLGQEAPIRLLKDDITKNRLPPALLLSGPEASGKLTAALEIARTLSCLGSGSWTCTCESCRRHKEFSANDLLILGARDTLLETKAAGRCLCTTPSIPARYLFTRSVRKLTNRFDPRLWDTDEPRFLKAAPILADIDEILSDFIAEYNDQPTQENQKKREKYITKIIDRCEKLQETCLYDTIPVNQVRKASSWVRLIPNSKKKVLIIENADKMQDSARNAFLKILEEPPHYTVFILTTTRRAAIIPTILSRVRTYTFAQREVIHQKAVIERVFRDHSFCVGLPEDSIRVAAYLQSFLSITAQQLYEAAAIFWEYCFNHFEEKKHKPAALIETILSYRARHPYKEDRNITVILKLLHNCKPHKIYILFLEKIVSFLQESLHTGACTAADLACYAQFSKLIRDAIQAVEIFNSSPQAALETLTEQIITADL